MRSIILACCVFFLLFLTGGCNAKLEEGTQATPPPGINLAAMVSVPAGVFTMGTDAFTAPKAYGPPHQVHLDTFLIDKFAVTNFQYKKFLDATGMPPPPHWHGGSYEPWLAFHPVLNVSRDEAAAYARHHGKRLPTEAEWEKAARGTDKRIFAWGNEWDAKRCNSCETEYLTRETVPVYDHLDSPGPYGCIQQTGNVWEWCSDRVEKKPYDPGPARNPRQTGGSYGVSRGGSWTTIWQGCRTFARCISIAGGRYGYTGFRCAKDFLPPAELKPPGMENMAKVPAGKFIHGAQDEQQFKENGGRWGRPDETPQREIHLDTFHIDKHPVTNAAYRRFVLAAGYPYPPDWVEGRFTPGMENFPVVNVSWKDATAYATWAGKRLPTEAEWEKAARGTDGRDFPWGNEYDGMKCNGINAKIFKLVAVDKFPAGASPYGCQQMAGNCWEWVADWYQLDYYKTMPNKNPQGPVTGKFRILRGGTWSSTKHVLTTTARCRATVGCHWSYTGFRCAK